MLSTSLQPEWNPWGSLDKKRKPPPFYGVNEAISLCVALIMGLQHCLAMVGGILAYPIAIGTTSGDNSITQCRSPLHPAVPLRFVLKLAGFQCNQVQICTESHQRYRRCHALLVSLLRVLEVMLIPVSVLLCYLRMHGQLTYVRHACRPHLCQPYCLRHHHIFSRKYTGFAQLSMQCQ